MTMQLTAKLPNCPICEEDELWLVPGEHPQVRCYVCGWDSEPIMPFDAEDRNVSAPEVPFGGHPISATVEGTRAGERTAKELGAPKGHPEGSREHGALASRERFNHA